MEKAYTIYALCCPKTDAVRYVGKTTNLKSRVSHHISVPSGSKTKKLWLAKLREIKLKPDVKVLEVLSDPLKAHNAERKYIKRHKKTLYNCIVPNRVLKSKSIERLPTISGCKLNGWTIKKRKKYLSFKDIAKRTGVSTQRICAAMQKGTATILTEAKITEFFNNL